MTSLSVVYILTDVKRYDFSVNWFTQNMIYMYNKVSNKASHA